MVKVGHANTMASALKRIDAYNKKYPKRRMIMIKALGRLDYNLYTYPR